MGDRIASNEDIVEHLNQLTNDDAAALIRFKKQQTKGKNDLALATSLKENFPEIDLAHPTRLRKYCDDFLQLFDNQYKINKQIQVKKHQIFRLCFCVSQMNVSINL